MTATEKVPPRQGSWRRRIVVLATGVAMVSLAAVVPVAAGFSDQGLLDTEYEGAFEIGGIDSAGAVHLPGDDDRITAEFDTINGLVPGNTAAVSVGVFNNSVASDADLTLAVSASGDVPALLRYSASITQDGVTTVLFGDTTNPANGVAADAIPDDLNAQLASRGVAPLQEGDAFVGEADTTATVQVLAHLLDDASTTALSSASTQMAIVITGSSS